MKMLVERKFYVGEFDGMKQFDCYFQNFETNEIYYFDTREEAKQAIEAYYKKMGYDIASYEIYYKDTDIKVIG